jgi:hypothetical protein
LVYYGRSVIPWSHDIPFNIHPEVSHDPYIAKGFYLYEKPGTVILDQGINSFESNNVSVSKFLSYAFCDSALWLLVENDKKKKLILTITQSKVKSFRDFYYTLDYSFSDYKPSWNKDNKIYVIDENSNELENILFINRIILTIVISLLFTIAFKRIFRSFKIIHEK